MSNSEKQLPAGFESLEPFVVMWAIKGANNRLQQRLASSEAERVAFFNTAKDLVPMALDFLDKKPLSNFDAKEERLMNLLLSMVHVSLAVEVQKEQEDFHAQYARFITITRASADNNP